MCLEGKRVGWGNCQSLRSLELTQVFSGAPEQQEEGTTGWHSRRRLLCLPGAREDINLSLHLGFIFSASQPPICWESHKAEWTVRREADAQFKNA